MLQDLPQSCGEFRQRAACSMYQADLRSAPAVCAAPAPGVEKMLPSPSSHTAKLPRVFIMDQLVQPGSTTWFPPVPNFWDFHKLKTQLPQQSQETTSAQQSCQELETELCLQPLP
ncbi:unnamed protein product [Peronospora belbahrii]|uniref:Uncharacterized protein n=1 Tax=Peronospora belbahrii TaxID=622444 RepID=A0AAU9L9Z2_9STRA|nr:unnamed protein product [Peronospora belbahrii]